MVGANDPIFILQFIFKLMPAFLIYLPDNASANVY